jgi:hypothetical protein
MADFSMGIIVLKMVREEEVICDKRDELRFFTGKSC